MGYVDSQQGAHARTAFRNAEKQYKRYKEASTRLRSSRSRNKIQPTDVSQVLDFSRYVDLVRDSSTKIDGVSLAPESLSGKPVFVLDAHPGFHFIPQALSAEEQHYWILESLTSFPQPPNRTNHNAEYGPIRDLWSAVTANSVLVQVASDEDLSASEREFVESVQLREESNVQQSVAREDEEEESNQRQGRGELSTSARGEDFGARDGLTTTARVTNEKAPEAVSRWRFESNPTSDGKPVDAESLLRRLRWATIGMQFDWSKKAYNTSIPYEKLPQKLSELAARLAAPAMGGSEFKAEAAIVNYYGPDDMLGGHVDDMEADWSKPIVSISLGCKAIFLLGGESRDQTPTAMFLRSGDVVLMSGAARTCFHGVPRIFTEDDNSDLPDTASLEQDPAGPLCTYIRKSRININIRQVY
ncbi:alkylated DNA repair protein alkB homolog 1 [Marchantia polymorpha subsp. ruderalis]|uniref:Fe2OG dioxygenase domain-containing protein n=2 Tax=Marchantia polymorpha TaxID=3197 RepID=A0AAF6AMU1_MARPO|nr:hypothetical protein MARPO_0036s0054 [Marchantia polymorpha]BBM97761.1 hypothetical protein Mp_1g08100 [Marchantia polymorpha subsp. ruderalis]|eukprot:PTQ41064.1 hypothetical protein MARPO_0036s0054 [Marchantia polymorpha]